MGEVVPDPLEKECARALLLQSDYPPSAATPQYYLESAREFLAMWRFVTSLEDGKPQPEKPATLDRAAVELAVGKERARTIGVIRDRQDEIMRGGDKGGNGYIRLNELVTVLDRIEGRSG